ncbi:MAG: pyridoxal phosphate-dependent aminotransferase [Hydrogenibacillus sp.]|nr:pyridoxal phosphate-dependent aminotransferase [Hydrogenibacillus sp.]
MPETNAAQHDFDPSFFDRPIDRRGTYSAKWERYPGDPSAATPADWIAMSIADMDFQVPEAIIRALQKRIEHAIFGYTLVSDSTLEAIVEWLRRRHGWSVEPEWIVISPGVVTSLALAIDAFSAPGEAAVVFPPVYTPFFHAVEQNHRRVLSIPLSLGPYALRPNRDTRSQTASPACVLRPMQESADGHGLRYRIDFETLERTLASGKSRLILLCHPHNPGGRIFTREELSTLAEIARRHDALIISDEIHADIVFTPGAFTPLASLPEAAERTIALWSPSKTFNIPGLRVSYMIIPNRTLRKKVQDALQRLHLQHVNALGLVAMEAAYRQGEPWLDAALAYIRQNIEFVRSAFLRALPGVRIMEPEGTYLVWMDLSDLPFDAKERRRRILEEAHVAVNFGEEYGPGGEGWIRLNVAAPRRRVEEGVGRLIRALSPMSDPRSSC